MTRLQKLVIRADFQATQAGLKSETRALGKRRKLM
jgi:hypothetical protein